MCMVYTYDEEESIRLNEAKVNENALFTEAWAEVASESESESERGER